MDGQAKNVLWGVGIGLVAGMIFVLSVASYIFQVNTKHQLDRHVEATKERVAEIKMESRIAMSQLFSSNSETTPEDFNKVYTIEPGATPVWGKPGAPVLITMFTDFQCPYCAQFYESFKGVLNAYPDKVRFMLKNFPLPFHHNAVPAAKAALAAGVQGKYFEMADLLMKNGGQAAESKLKEYAKALGLDEKTLLKNLKDKDSEFEKQIREDMDLGGRCDIRGTPTFFLNGKKTQATDLNSWKAQIDKILKAK